MMKHIQSPVYYRKCRLLDIFSHIVAYLVRAPCTSCIFRTLSYLESWYIKNQIYIQYSGKTYSGIFKTLCNARVFWTLIWWFNNIKFLFFHFSLPYFSTKFKDMFFDNNDVNFKCYNNNIIKLTFSSDSKFYDRKRKFPDQILSHKKYVSNI